MEGTMKEKMKRDKDERKDDFFVKYVSKKKTFRTNYSSIFSSKVQNLTVFSIIYMTLIRFFASGK